MRKKLTTLLLLLALIVVGCKQEPQAHPSSPLADKKEIQLFIIKTEQNSHFIERLKTNLSNADIDIIRDTNINRVFLKEFGKSSFRSYHLLMFMDKQLTLNLIKKYPNIGLLTPLNMAIYKKATTLTIAILTPNAIAHAIKISTIDPLLITYADKVRKAIIASIKSQEYRQTTVHSLPLVYRSLSAKIDNLDDFEAKVEENLNNEAFLIPNYIDLKEKLFNKYDYNAYDFYHIYSLYRIKNLYETLNAHPEFGVLYPYSLSLYKKKSTQRSNISFFQIDMKKEDNLTQLIQKVIR